MPGRKPTKQALSKLEEVRKMIREAEVELRESAYYPPPEANHHLSEAASGLAVAERALRSVLKVLRTPGETPSDRLWAGTEEGKEQVSIFPTKILLATDGSEEAELALGMAVELANSTDSELHVLSVGMPDLPDYVELLEEAYRRFERRGQQTLAEQVKKVEEAGGIVVKAHFTMEGPPGQEIVHFAERLDAGMIVMGSRGLGGLGRALLGSASDSVVRHAHCPVMVVRKEERPARLPAT
jgi:nucleotide-binding universal stress UspA family protein